MLKFCCKQKTNKKKAKTVSGSRLKLYYKNYKKYYIINI